MIKLLLSYGAMVDAEDYGHWTTLTWPAEKACKFACTALLEAGANPELRTIGNGSSPLTITAEDGYLEAGRALLEKVNAKVNAMTNSNWTTLTRAAVGGHLEMARLLIEHGATGNSTPYGSWENFLFKDNVSKETQTEIVEMVRR
jgi:ankyrin repeat protein